MTFIASSDEGGILPSDYEMTEDDYRTNDVLLVDIYNRDMVFTDDSGWLARPSDETVKRSIENFCYGQDDLTFHAYYLLNVNKDDDFPVVHYLLKKYGYVEEYVAPRENIWYTRIATRQRQTIMRICTTDRNAYILIGQENTFKGEGRRFLRALHGDGFILHCERKIVKEEEKQSPFAANMALITEEDDLVEYIELPKSPAKKSKKLLLIKTILRRLL